MVRSGRGWDRDTRGEPHSFTSRAANALKIHPTQGGKERIGGVSAVNLDPLDKHTQVSSGLPSIAAEVRIEMGMC